MLYYYFKHVLQIAAHCQKNLDLAVAAKESGEIAGGGVFCIYSGSSCLNVGLCYPPDKSLSSR